MSEENNVVTAPPKPAKAKARSRRNYQAELIDLQGRVDTAVRLMKKMAPLDGTADAQLRDIAIETLEGSD